MPLNAACVELLCINEVLVVFLASPRRAEKKDAPSEDLPETTANEVRAGMSRATTHAKEERCCLRNPYESHRVDDAAKFGRRLYPSRRRDTIRRP